MKSDENGNDFRNYEPLNPAFTSRLDAFHFAAGPNRRAWRASLQVKAGFATIIGGFVEQEAPHVRSRAGGRVQSLRPARVLGTGAAASCRYEPDVFRCFAHQWKPSPSR